MDSNVDFPRDCSALNFKLSQTEFVGLRTLEHVLEHNFSVELLIDMLKINTYYSVDNLRLVVRQC